MVRMSSLCAQSELDNPKYFENNDNDDDCHTSDIIFTKGRAPLAELQKITCSQVFKL